MQKQHSRTFTRYSQHGFTIVELLIVIVIIGILATIVIVAYNGVQQRAKIAVIQSDLEQAAKFLEAYRFTTSSTEQYPTANDCSSSPAVDTTCLKSSNGTGYQYTVDNSVTPPTFCLTATNGTLSYFVTNTGNPSIGGCPGHLVSGLYGSLPVATSIEGYWSTAPQGFLLEDGSAVSRSTYSDLFSVIGTTYGVGDGSTTFNLPDSRGRVSVNVNSSDTEFDTIGEKYGTKTETLAIAQLPVHNHGLTQAYSYAGVASPTGAPATHGYSGAASYNTGDRGGDGPHNNIQPSIVKVFAIKYVLPDPSAADLAEGTSITGYWPSIPSGYLVEDGAAVSRTTYSSLFAVIGTTHGAGNGTTTFNLPDSRGRTGVGRSSSDTEFDTLGEKYGEKAHTLTIAEMPAHNHGLTQAYTYASGSSPATHGYSGAASYNTGDRGGGQSHNEVQPSIARSTVIKHTAASTNPIWVAAGTSIEGYWTTAPTGFLLEDGAAVSRTTYASLFAAVGTTYGVGNGSTTFNLPDARGRTAVNRNSSDTEFDTIGEKYGTKTETLTITQMPSHNHGLTQNYTYVGVASPTGAPATHGYSGAASYNTGDRGGDGPHNNIQPSIVRNFAIKY